MRFTIRLSDDPSLAEIGWAAARRGDHLAVAVSTRLPRWQQEVAALEAATDGEYELYEASLPVEERERRAAISRGRPWMTPREALIAYRSAFGRAGVYDKFVKSLPIPEQRRRYIDVPAGQVLV